MNNAAEVGFEAQLSDRGIAPNTFPVSVEPEEPAVSIVEPNAAYDLPNQTVSGWSALPLRFKIFTILLLMALLFVAAQYYGIINV